MRFRPALAAALLLSACAVGVPPQAPLLEPLPAPEAAELPPPPPPPPPPDPRELVGLSDGAVSQKLGPPEFLRREGAAQVWQYSAPACVMHLFLYSGSPDGPALVAHFAAASRNGAEGEADPLACYKELLEARAEGRNR